MIVTIDGINRKMIDTKQGEKQSIGIIQLEEKVTDVNGDELVLDGRWINGFQDKSKETDQWEKGTRVKIQISLKTYTRKDGTEAEAVNFRLPEGSTSIMGQETEGGEPEKAPVDTPDAEDDPF